MIIKIQLFLYNFSFIKIAILYQVTPIFIQYENSFGLLFNDIYFYQIAMMIIKR